MLNLVGLIVHYDILDTLRTSSAGVDAVHWSSHVVFSEVTSDEDQNAKAGIIKLSNIREIINKVS